MHKASIGIVLGSLFLSSAALAEGGAKYGAAGCGLGSVVFGNKPGLVQVLAATTNATFYSQTLGITFGTSNCGEQGSALATTKAFVVANREALMKDAARGSGETVASIAAIGGCGDAAVVGASLQRNFQSIYPSASVSDEGMADAVVGALKSDVSLHCSKL